MQVFVLSFRRTMRKLRKELTAHRRARV